jgi:photosystem II stability/assembly factor-like uncharacterized protein
LTYYAATASGGVWKSVDGGLTWKPIFDDQPTSSIGSIAVAPSDPNVIYVGTGEANIRGNVSSGAGIFRSTDAGKTWKHVWKQRGQIGTMIVHPKNADIAYAAVLGHAFGPNKERGVYRTTDGGKTWQQILKKDVDTGSSDIALDVTNPRILLAGFWQARRRGWELTSGGPGSDLFLSRDGGDTWTSLKPAEEKSGKKPKQNGLPAGIWGKVGVAISPANPQRMFAMIEAEKGGLYRSDDGGEKWELMTDDRNIRQRAWYFSLLTPHPTNSDVLYAPSVPMLKSIDGGRTFKKQLGFHHVDHHDVWIDPKNPDRIVVSNDGGVEISTNGGQTWNCPPLPISQFYHVHADNSTPYKVMGCMQDLGSASGPSRSGSGKIGLEDWHGIGGGEAGHAVSKPDDPNIVYAGEYGGIMTRYDHRTRQARNISINQINPSGIDPYKLKYRFNWTSPIVVSKHDPKTVYHCAQFVFRTQDDGKTWQKISPDLTRNDKSKQQWSGGPITGDNTGAEIFCTIFALAESPRVKDLLWAGSDDGRVHLTRDGGKTWKDVTANIPGLPDWGTVTCIEPSPHDAGTAFLVVDNHRNDDDKPYVWKTTNFGTTWESINTGLPSTTHCKAVREDPKLRNLLFLGTERGVKYSRDAGKTWNDLQLNLPTVPVHDLVIKNDDLVLGTHGRSLWILDDITVLRERTSMIESKPSHLYTIRPAIRWQDGGGPITDHHRESQFDNPPAGARIWFSLAEKPKMEAEMHILNAEGNIVAKAKYDPQADHADAEEDEDDHSLKLKLETGLNFFDWDLTHDSATTIPKGVADLGEPSTRVQVSPGKYTARLTWGKQKLEQSFIVVADPRYPVNAAAETARETLALKVRDQITLLSQSVITMQNVKKQTSLQSELLKKNPQYAEYRKALESFEKKLATVEEKFHNAKAKISYDIFALKGGAMLYSQLTWLLVNLAEANGEPTQPQKDLAQELEAELSKLVKDWNTLVANDLKALNVLGKKAGVPELFLPARD